MFLKLEGPAEGSAAFEAFEIAQHLGGPSGPANAEPMVDAATGQALHSDALAHRLAAFGVGDVPITVHGLLIPHGMGGQPDPFLTWSQEGTFPLGLSPGALATAVYALARKELATYPAGETPPVLWVTAIEIGTPKWIIRYRDTVTGRLVKRETWERSRRARRAHGSTGTGRYVRVRLQVSR